MNEIRGSFENVMLNAKFIVKCIVAFFVFFGCEAPVDLSDQKELIDFSFSTSNYYQISTTSEGLHIEFYKFVDISNIKPIVRISPGAIISPQSGEAVNLNFPVQYVITAENGSTKCFIVTAGKNLSPQNNIISFELQIAEQKIEIEGENIYIYVPNEIDISNVGTKIDISQNAIITPANGVKINFTLPQKYIVTSSDGHVKEYTVTVKKSPWRRLLANGEAPFMKVDGHRLLVYDGYMWLLGGWLGDHHDFPIVSGDYWTSQVWRTKDGIHWEDMGDAPWNPRHGFGCVSYQGKMWIISGDSNRDIWNSVDGKTWTCVQYDVPFNWRYFPYVTVFKDRIWLIGGKNGWWNIYEVYNDVWSSEDGVNWIQNTRTANFAPRSMINGSVVLRDELYVIGGGGAGPIEKSASYNDVWKSGNGIDFRSTTIEAPFSPLYWHSIGVYRDKMYVLGGLHRGDIHTNEVWFSENGVVWTQQKHTFWESRHATSVVEFEGKLYMIGGTSDPTTARNTMNDVWVMEGDLE